MATQNTAQVLANVRKQLRQEADVLARELARIERFLEADPVGFTAPMKRRAPGHISPAGRERIAAAQRARWARTRAAKKAVAKAKTTATVQKAVLKK